MSIINQMLLDLEKRHVPRLDGVLSQARALPPTRSSMSTRWAVLLVLLILVVGVFAWQLLREEEPTPAIANASVPVPAAPPAKLATGEKTVAEDLVVAEPLFKLASRLSLELNNPPPEPEQLVPDKPAAKPANEPPVKAKSKPTPSSVAAINKQMRQETPQQQAENEYRKAAAHLQQGKIQEAEESFRQALRLNSNYAAARLALAGLLLQEKRANDAENLLREGLDQESGQAGFAMILARIQVEKGETQAALETLQKTLPHAAQNADYRAFLAALLQRESRHSQAVEQYQAALQLKPAGVWYMGLGISLQALQRLPEARDAFQQAMISGALSPELQAYVEQRLRQVK
ncbi:MAG TPA: tetratricopeptide repeat protein [Burkholderiales bacterium]|nr:tetratricopeptide repeat protein [Burkholderiales bacterium]